MTVHPRIPRLVALENRQMERLLSTTVLGRLEQLDDEDLVEILLHRRQLALGFSEFCDTVMCAFEAEEARAIATEIMQAEYRVSNHREDFVRELELLGRSRAEIVTYPLSAATARCKLAIHDMARAVVHLRDLERLIVLRYFGEVTPGLEFAKLFADLKRRGMLSETTSVFLWPHVEYDVLGADGAPSHADRYLEMICVRLTDDAKWRSAEVWVRRAARIRHAFYRQFDG